MFFLLFPYLFLGIILCMITIIDLREQRIPDKVLVIAILVKVFHATIGWYFGCFDDGMTIENVKYWEVLWKLMQDGGMVSLPLLIFTIFAEKMKGKEVLGGGDIKLIFVTGMYLGWERNLWMLLIACVIGSAIGLIRRRTNKQESEYFSFGPIIALATVLCMGI